MNSDKYITISSLVWSRESKMLDHTDIERMVDAPSFDDAYRVLNDTDYADNLLDLEPAQYRDAMRKDFTELYEFLKRDIPDYDLFRLLFIERDFLNLRLLLKEKYLGVKEVESFEGETVYPPEDIKSYMNERKSMFLDEKFKDLIVAVEKEVEANSGAPWIVDVAVTKAMYQMQYEIADNLGNEFIKRSIQIKISNATVIAFMRALRFELPANEFKKMLSDNSFWSVGELMTAYESGEDGVTNFLASYESNEVKESLREYLENKNLFEFERDLDNYFISYINQARYLSYGPEQVYSYFQRKHSAVINIRLIMAGKMNEIDSGEIKRTLRAI